MIPLLPYEKRLAEILGISEDDYRQWKAITLERSITQPAAAEGPTCGALVPVLVNLAIAVGVTLLSSLLFPSRQPPRLDVRQGRRDNLTNNQRLSPRFGFDSMQEPARVGQFVPVVIAKRENNLGGVRVAMPLIWSQMLAYNGSSMFRGIFLAGTAGMAQDAWDPRGWAFGNNSLGAYSLDATALATSARYSIYWRRNGGRITSGDLIAGRQASGDPGNFQNLGGQDVFSLKIGAGQFTTAFCMAETPSTNASFGLYGWCPNAMLHREQATIQPTILARISDSDKVRTDDDASALVEVWKGKFNWSMRGALRQHKPVGSSTWLTPASGQFHVHTQSVAVGDQLLYVLDKSTDAGTIIKFNTLNSRIVSAEAEAEEPMDGVAASVASIQNSADSALVPNELYMIGTCMAVLEARIPEDASKVIFISDSEEEPIGNGNTVSYRFTVVRAGSVQFAGSGFLNPPETGTTIFPPYYNPYSQLYTLSSGTEGRYKVCSQAAQIFRAAVASISAVREYKVCEMVIRSRVGITVNGATRYNSCPTVLTINTKAGQGQAGTTANGVLGVSRYVSGLITTKLRRYSAFSIRYSLDRGATWTAFPEVFAIAGIGGEEVHNYLRIVFPYSARWQFDITPVPSWQIRSFSPARIVVIDTNSTQEVSATANGITIFTTGYSVDPTAQSVRKASIIEPAFDIGIGWSDPAFDSMFDGYAKFAEAFPYGSVQTTVGDSPEHQIQQVNFYGDTSFTPSYESLAAIGINISASQEMNSLQSFSGFCNNGHEMPRLLNGDTKGASHLFPDWLREVMTNPDLGADPPTQLAQIDRPSFQAAAQWCQDREYFYDKFETDPLDILDWATQTAQHHLLKLAERGGVYYLDKAINFDTPLDIKAQFNNGNIAEGSFSLNTIDYLTRQPFIVQVKWREESTGSQSPLFARERVAMVRQAGTSANAPVRTLDLSPWCTNYKQAIDAACYYIKFVTLNDHSISFKTTPDVLAAQLFAGSFFILDLDVINYSTAFQGFIQDNGVMVSTRPWMMPLTDGAYPALTWDMSTDPQEQTITIINGAASPTNVFFAIRSSAVKPRVYETKKINIGEQGVISVEAFHHPTDANGFSMLGVGWTTYQTDSNWIIEL
jgi:hypothetical protein